MQRRLEALRTHLHQAHDQRQHILEQLAPDNQAEKHVFGRRGQEVLRLTHMLEQVEQEIDAAGAALQALRQEATQAGAPAAWVQ